MLPIVTKLQPIRVTLDILKQPNGTPAVFQAFTNGRTWNGWAAPWFRLDEGKRIVSVFNALNEGDGAAAWYDDAEDIFVFLDDGGEETFGGAIIQGENLYGIGNCAWCWNEV